MRFAWRYVVMSAFIFWLGGFTFYISIVVPAATKVQGDALAGGAVKRMKPGHSGEEQFEPAKLAMVHQGFITRQVTKAINWAAVIALSLLVIDLFVTPGARWSRALLLAVMAACQAGLFPLHGHLDSFMDPDTLSIHNRPVFYQWHRLYLYVHLMQWIAALIYLGLLMMVWGPSGNGSGSGSTGATGAG
jgi:hypothetical protein